MLTRPKTRPPETQRPGQQRARGLGSGAAAVALIATVGLAAGCGSSGSSPQQAATTSTSQPPATSTTNPQSVGNGSSTSTTPNTTSSTSSAHLVSDLCKIPALTTIAASGLHYPSTADFECIHVTALEVPPTIQTIQLDNSVDQNNGSLHVNISVQSDSNHAWEQLIQQNAFGKKISVNGLLTFYSTLGLETLFKGEHLSVSVSDSIGTDSTNEALAAKEMIAVETQGLTAG